MKNKEYINFEDRPKFTISWFLRNGSYAFPLNLFLDEGFLIYKRGMFSDEGLGKVKSVFSIKDKKFYLDYEPSFIKEGIIRNLPRKNIRLNQPHEEHKVLELPKKYYVIRN